MNTDQGAHSSLFSMDSPYIGPNNGEKKNVFTGP